MFRTSDYNMGVAEAPKKDVLSEIDNIVKVEVEALTTTIAQDVADVATANLVGRFALKTDLDTVSGTVANNTTSLSRLSGIVSSHTDTLAAESSQLTTAETKLNTLNTTVTTHTTTLGQLSTTVSGHTSTLDSQAGQLTTLDTKWNTLNTTVTAHTTSLGQLNTTVSGHTSTLDSHTGQITTLNTQVTSLNSTVATHTTSLGQLSTTVSGHTTTIDSHTGQLTTLNTQVTTMSGTVAGHTTSLGQLSTLVSGHTTELSTVETALALLNNSGTGSSIVLGGATGPAANTVTISNKAGTKSYLYWNATNRSPIQMVDDAASATLPVLDNGTMLVMYNSTQLVANVKKSNGQSMTINIGDAATYATKTSVDTLSTTVSGLSTQINNLSVTQDVIQLGATITTLQTALSRLTGINTDNNVILGTYTPPAGTTANTFITNYNGAVYMRWLSTSSSAIHSVAVSTATPTLTVDNTMTFGIATENSVSFLVAQVRAASTTVSIPIKDYDTPLSKLTGTATGSNVILGGYSAPVDNSVTGNTFIASSNGTVCTGNGWNHYPRTFPGYTCGG